MNKLPKPFIQGKKIDLRPLIAADVEGEYVNWLNDAVVCGYNAHHVFPYSREQALGYIADKKVSKKDVVLAIVTKGKQSKHIGNSALQNIDYINRSAEFAIIIGDKNFWGKGVATEAASLLIAHGFEVLNLHRIYCGTSSKNIPMQKLALALGFKQEGCRKQALYKNAEYVDVLEYGLVRKKT